MDKKNALIILTLVSLATVVGSAGLVVFGSGTGEDNGFSREMIDEQREALEQRELRGRGFRLDLTDEQREALKTRIQEISPKG